MCGISGAFDTDARRPEEDVSADVQRMTDALLHRGPDDAGVWVDAEAGIGLGHRRLAIMDLSKNGHQPMSSADGRYVIVFNGEVYNFRSLRAELQPLGHEFRGTSDTEVMLAAICQWGLAEALGRFIGMFAFALWDRRDRTLHLVRDRVGIKPLYYGWCSSTLLFGSELKALRAHPAFAAPIDREAFAAYLQYDYVPGPRTIYRGIHKLPPGTILSASAAVAARAEPLAYWSAREVARQGRAGPLATAPEEAVDQLDALLRDAVRLRLESDVPLGAFLSGGIDSSVVVALMQAVVSRRVRTFTIGVADSRYDEAPQARAVARHLGTEHTELYVEPAEALKLIPQIPDWYDEPFADSSQLPTYLVSRMTRRHVTVSLSGDGGDELFAGYPRYRWAERIWTVVRRLSPAIRRRIVKLIERVPAEGIDAMFARIPGGRRAVRPGDRAHKLASTLALDGVDAIYRRLVGTESPADGLIAGQVAMAAGALNDSTLARDFPEFIPRSQLLDLLTYLPDDILTKLDRASMAVSLEARVPLLDHRVVELAWRLPLSLKIRGGQPKWILRQVLYRYVPKSLVDRPKMGFGVPIDAWLRGPLRDWAEDLLSEPALRADGLFDPRGVRRKWTEHLSGTRNWPYLLWGVLMFQAWRRRWV